MPVDVTPIADRVFAAVAGCFARERLLAAVLEETRTVLGAVFAAVASIDNGVWHPVARSGEGALPYDLLAEALDHERVVVHGPWVAAPLPCLPGPHEVLVLGGATGVGEPVERTVAQLASWLAAALTAVAIQSSQRRRVERLEAILEISAQWRQTLEMDRLLEQMAEAAVRLLAAERASIFLWDRGTKTLVGRPALGVEGGELRIPDNTGVVGQVVHSGEPRRVDLERGQQEIDRRVDRQLGYQTRTLLCVPLRGRGGKLFGAFELINKRAGNFTNDDELALTELATHAAVALENTQHYEQLLKSRNHLTAEAAAGARLIGECPAITDLRSTISRVADTELSVLLLGENGTGKEVIARCIHYLSRRRHEPFVAVNCAALAETLLESELFGHEKGAFTDAHATRAGRFELAAGGTLFLDEIGDMSLNGQAKLLRVLDEKTVVRVGGSLPIHTDARVIAATNQNLAELVRQRRFREDLYFRLNVVTLEVPPLRDRGQDIVLLAEQFLEEFSAQARRTPPRLTAAARKRLLNHAWPGNVRELRNLMERIAYLSSEATVDADELAFILSPRGEGPSCLTSDLPLAEATREFQIQFIQRQIQRSQGNISAAAERLGLQRANLYRKMRQLGIE